MNDQIPLRTLTVAGAGWGARAGRAMTQATQTLGAEGRRRRRERSVPMSVMSVCPYCVHVCYMEGIWYAGMRSFVCHSGKSHDTQATQTLRAEGMRVNCYYACLTAHVKLLLLRFFGRILCIPE